MKSLGPSLLAATGAIVPVAALSIANPDTPAQIVLPDRRVCTYVGPQPRSLGDPVT